MSREEDYLFDQLLKHALIDVEEKQVQEADQFCSEHSGPLPFQPSSRYRKSLRRLCLKSRLRERDGVKGILKKGLIWIAVALALLLGLAMTTPASRDWLFHFFIQDYGDHAQIDFNKTNDYLPEQINTGLSRFYSPTWLPDGFELTDHQEGEIDIYLNYTLGDKCISIYQLKTLENNATVLIDTENTEQKILTINGLSAWINKKNDYIGMTMHDGELLISIIGIGIDEKNIVEFAQSLE